MYATPKQKHLQAEKEWSASKRHQAPYLGEGYREQWQKSPEKKPPVWSALKSSNFGILGHYTQATILINGRKSINPTILSIQIRNELQIWPTKKIEWDNE